MNTYYIGVDGGATKCIIRVEDEHGQLLGQEVRGPANIRLSVQSAWDAILSGVHAILEKHQLKLHDPHNTFYAGMGLAGCEVIQAYQDFIHFKHPFQSLIVTSDAHTACLGAHQGQDGAILIIGTGVVGLSLQSDHLTQVGGYGFPHDDRGGGAFLGLEAVNISLRAHDGRLPPSALSKAVITHFNHDPHALIAWANQANSTAFATLAPLVIQTAEAHDPAAIQLMQQAAEDINEIFYALKLKTQRSLPYALIGGIAPFIEKLLSHELKTWLTPAKASPEIGAILLARHSMKKG